MRNLSYLIGSLCLFLFLACNNTGNSSNSTTNEPKTAAIAKQKAERPEVEKLAESNTASAPIAEATKTAEPTASPSEKETKAKTPKTKSNQPAKASPPAPENKSKEERQQAAPKAKAQTEAPKSVDPPKSTAIPAAEKPKIEAAPEKVEPVKPAAPKALSHTPWDELLRKHVSASGKVNYRGIKGESSKLDSYLKDLADNPVKSDWSRGQKMAYWINAYNAYTIKLIIDNYPVSSITKLDGGKPWDRKWIKLGTDTYSLNDIENNILRPRFKDARIHFAVNCAAKSCPPVLNRAWTAANLNSNFEKQTKAFINGSLNEISSKKVKVSKIFDWYKEDFGDLITFLNKYSTQAIDKGAKIEFIEYDWALNE